MLEEILILLFILLLIFAVHFLLPYFYNTKIWQIYFIGLLSIEEKVFRDFPFSLVYVSMVSFTLAVWWASLGGFLYTYLFFLFLVGFYLQLKRQFFSTELVHLYLNKLEPEKKENLSGDDLIGLINFVSFHIFKVKVTSRLGSRLSKTKFPHISKRFFAGNPNNMKVAFEWVAEKSGAFFAAVSGLMGIAYYENRQDKRGRTTKMLEFHQNSIKPLDKYIKENRDKILDCLPKDSSYSLLPYKKCEPCKDFDAFVGNQVDKLFEKSIHLYGLKEGHSDIDRNAMIEVWLDSHERIIAIQKMKRYILDEKVKSLIPFEERLLSSILPKLIHNYENGATSSIHPLWEPLPPYTKIGPKKDWMLTDSTNESIVDDDDEVSQSGAKTGQYHLGSNPPGTTSKAPALPPSSKATSSMVEDNSFFESFFLP